MQGLGATCADEARSGTHAAGTYSRQMIWRLGSLELAIGGEDFGGQPGPDKSWPNLWSLGKCSWPLMLSHFPVSEPLGSQARKPSQTCISDEVLSGWVSESATENGAATPLDPHFPLMLLRNHNYLSALLRKDFLML